MGFQEKSATKQMLRKRVLTTAGTGVVLGVLLFTLMKSSWLEASSSASSSAENKPAHHTPFGFVNTDGRRLEKGLLDVLAWQLKRRPARLPVNPIPETQPNLNASMPNVTWIGHSTVLGQLPLLQNTQAQQGSFATWRWITDPMFSERASPVGWAGPKRLYPPALQLAQLPAIQVVLISHNHYDHLDLPSVKALAAQSTGSPLFVVPLGLKSWMNKQGIDRVVELDWWQTHRQDGVDITFVPSKHWSSRYLFDRNQSLWGGYVLTTPAHRLIYTGDTGYSADFKRINEYFNRQSTAKSFDLALIPIGCYEPREFMKGQHINPHEAVTIFKDLRAQKAVGVHWGTFQDLCDEPLDQAPIDLQQALLRESIDPTLFVAPKRGETIEFGK